MNRISMTTEEFQHYLFQKEKELMRTIYADGIFEEDLNDFGLDYFILDEGSPICRYIFYVKDGFIVVCSEVDSSMLNIKTMQKADDDLLKEMVEEKERLVKKMNGVETFLQHHHHRLKTLFL